MAVNTALVYMTVCTSVGKRLHALSSYPALGGSYGVGGGTVTKKNIVFGPDTTEAEEKASKNS